ncbi:MAG TPA: hypothetical protein VG412_06745 [Acidimicrobiales bacterium]|nr:hypothetical protein [Acidimicrobiales bacterium]
MNRSPVRTAITLALVFVGVLGAALAVTGLLIGLPAPAAGGTCGPGQGSEAAIVALFDPITIGAGPEPPAANPAGRAQWTAFVDECQTAADDRAWTAFPVLVVSSGIAILGFLAFRRRSRGRIDSTPHAPAGGWPPPPWSSPWAGPSPSVDWDPSLWPPGVPLPTPPPPLPPPPWPESRVP